ncbi:MAG TPA: hypothetical protein VKR31_10080 [Rhizomicrobium sp.]|nr:hypothetical protein [Rhizomicrobium sp.]
MTGRTNHRARARALEAAARELESEATRLRRAAAVQEDLESHAERMESVPRALRQVRLRMDRGVPEASAIAQAADIFELPPASLAVWWRESIDRTRHGERWRRDREIMRLAWAGKTNAEIGKLVKLAPGSVSRVIRAKIREGALLGIIAKENLPPRSPQIRETGSGGMSISPPTPLRSVRVPESNCDG